MSDPTPTVLRRLDALGRGYTDGELRATCRSGGLRRLRPGTYLRDDVFAALDAAGLHRALIAATLLGVSADAVVSHQSAAVLHGLPVWALPLDRVHVTRDRSGGGKRTRHLHSHRAPLPADDVVRCDGIPVTSVARTVADLRRSAVRGRRRCRRRGPGRREAAGGRGRRRAGLRRTAARPPRRPPGAGIPRRPE